MRLYIRSLSFLHYGDPCCKPDCIVIKGRREEGGGGGREEGEGEGGRGREGGGRRREGGRREGGGREEGGRREGLERRNIKKINKKKGLPVAYRHRSNFLGQHKLHSSSAQRHQHLPLLSLLVLVLRNKIFTT